MTATTLSYTDDGDIIESQYGREITVYVFKYDKRYDIPWDDKQLGKQFENEPVYWGDFIIEAERLLNEAGVGSNGCAQGDRPLPKCKYASIRNDAYIYEIMTTDSEILRSYMYPPSFCGYNAAGHTNPFENIIAVLASR
jgi:hypothetical protein